MPCLTGKLPLSRAFSLDNQRQHQFGTAQKLMNVQEIIKNKRILQIEQAQKDYEQNGYAKVYSTELGRTVYYVSDNAINKAGVNHIADPTLSLFFKSDLEVIKDLSETERVFLQQARLIFGGPIKQQMEGAKQ